MKIYITILFSIISISSTCFAQSSSGGGTKITKSLNVTLVGYYSLLSKTNQNGDKSVAKGYTLGADASMMLLKVSQGWGFGPFASYTFTDARNASSSSEKWGMRNFQAGIRMIVASAFIDLGYSTSALTFTKDPNSFIGLSQGFVVGAGVTIFGSELILRAVARYSIETIQKNDQITYSSNFNSLMFGAQLGYSF